MEKSGYTLVVLGLCGTGSLALGIAFSGCASIFVPPALALEETKHQIAGGIERNEGPLPESEWNRAGIWYRASGEPPTYLPVGYGTEKSRTQEHGNWVIDQRDGKRFFVPHQSTGEFPSRILLAEAKKITTWSPRERRFRSNFQENWLKTIIMTP